MGKYKPKTIADYFLYKQDMSQKKLHKMLYFAYAWYLYYNNDNINDLSKKLFEPMDPKQGFQAWVHGPVFRELYPEFAKYGFKEISLKSFDLNCIDKKDIDFFEEILDVYGKFSADQLEALSHKHTAWLDARKGYAKDEVCKVVLDDKKIFQYISDM